MPVKALCDEALLEIRFISASNDSILRKESLGKGYIGEAGEALIQYGFTSLGLRRIEAEIDPDNHASAKALEKLGFAQEGLLRQRWEIGGVVSDSALYGRLASDRFPLHT